MAADTNDVDPRLTGEADLRPIVAPGRARPMSGWISAFLLLAMGVALFVMLDARRRASSAPATTPRTVDDSGAPEPITPLFVPRLPPPLTPEAVVPPPISAPEPPAYPPPSPPMTTPIVRPPPFPFLHPPPSPRGSNDPVLVVDTPEDEAAPGTAPPGSSGTDEGGASGSAAGATSQTGAAVSTRVGATLMHHRATTVPQGTLIPAVLETALDSTRSGLTRALVSTDVRGFDGSRVLIPRGSRLIGEYRADVQSGQNRALVTWTRLIRPDGVTIAIGSPAADPLGRIGIKGSVDSHFLAKFGSAILQSALDIGVNLASHAGGGGETTVLALPNSTQVGSSSLVGNTQVQPTLRVREGAAIDVFVARDLDFTAVEIAQ